MHGDSLLMLTTKVVSNKKPPLLSDSESGGSTSPYSLFYETVTTVIKKYTSFRFLGIWYNLGLLQQKNRHNIKTHGGNNTKYFVIAFHQCEWI